MQPETPPARSATLPYAFRFNVWGVFLVVLGLGWLLDDLGIVSLHGGWIGPLAIITAGAAVLIGRGRRHEKCEH